MNGKLWSIFFILILNSLSNNNVSGGETWAFYEDFEFENPVFEEQWIVGNLDDQSIERIYPHTEFFAAASGDRGLYVKSRPNGEFRVSRGLHIRYHESFGMSLQIFNSESYGGIRIHFEGSMGQFSLEYGMGSSEWVNENRYYFGIDFPSGEWFNLRRNIREDIDVAFEDINAPASNYIPKSITTISLLQKGDGNVMIENYFDDLILFAEPIYLEELNTDQIIVNPTVTVTETQEAEERTSIVTEYKSESHENLITSGWGFLLIIFGAIGYHFLNKSTIRKKLSRLKLTCLECGYKNTADSIFCGECGNRN